MPLFKVDSADIASVAERLTGMSAGLSTSAAMVTALNEVVDAVYVTARSRMNSGINLADAYLQSKMQVQHASSGNLSASIFASGSEKGDQSPLGRYFTSQNVVAAAKAKGDPKRGIAPGFKQAGVSVEVLRGASKPVMGGKAFTMTLKSGNGTGIFVRTKYGQVRHLYGPAVYQLFRVAAGELDGAIGDTVEERLSSVAQRALQDALA